MITLSFTSSMQLVDLFTKSHSILCFCFWLGKSRCFLLLHRELSMLLVVASGVFFFFFFFVVFFIFFFFMFLFFFFFFIFFMFFFFFFFLGGGVVVIFIIFYTLRFSLISLFIVTLLILPLFSFVH